MTEKLNFQEQKTSEAIGIILQHAGKSLSLRTLLQLLYLIDRTALQNWERPITYDSYINENDGLILVSTRDLINGTAQIDSLWGKFIHLSGRDVIVSGIIPKIKKLSRADIELIQQIYERYGELDEISLTKSIQLLPEIKNKSQNSIQITIADILSALFYSPPEINRVCQELEEEADIASIFEGR